MLLDVSNIVVLSWAASSFSVPGDVARCKFAQNSIFLSYLVVLRKFVWCHSILILARTGSELQIEE
jgi:hypothetical protein